MSSTCQNIKIEYDSLKTLKEVFALAYATAKESGDFSSVRQLKKDLEQAKEKLEEKLFAPWAKPIIPEFMTLESHKEGIHFIDPSDIELYLEPEQLSSRTIKGTELLQRLRDKQSLNASALDFLLAHSELIPESWKKDENGTVRYIHFTDTLYRDSVGGLSIRYLSCNNGLWTWYYSYLTENWDERDSVAIPAS